MSDRSFTSFLVESFATLRRELPDVYRALCWHFDRREVTITVADELVVLRFEAQQVRRVAHALHPAITVATSKDSILSLVNARVTLVDAVLSDQLQLRGSPDDLLTFHDGLMIYLHGAVRAPSFPRLLRAYCDVA